MFSLESFSSRRPSRAFRTFFSLTLLGLAPSLGLAQSSSNLPDAPATQASPAKNNNPALGTVPVSELPTDKRQTKRILGVMPNYRAVSVDAIHPKSTATEKLKVATAESLDYSSFVFTGALAGISMAEDSYPEFRQGAVGYGRYYWHMFVDKADGNYLTIFVIPTLTREDPRYYTMGHGGFLKRTAYAFTRVLITPTDSGSNTLNLSEIVGKGAASGIANFYYPDEYRTWTKTGQRWEWQIYRDGATNIFREFWPDINAHVFHGKG
ncbi:MAG: hypothetical protein HIU93_05330 [Acidobacteria bacterium]|uniref:Uncharacterized protein n=1 Tax=Acidipila rosea TaxID=768535 RepID=A0A4R1L6A4_9BACT|nr:hypothetical protein [Acidobacteriota bacterium]TCK73685.1 hypothetical protein C7378_1298 [Acidipila rosea]